MGIPLPILWGLLSFITNYIPYIGFWLGLIPPALLDLLEGGPGMMLAVIALYAVINFIVQNSDPAQVRGRHCRHLGHADSAGSRVLGVGARSTRCISRASADLAC